VTEREMYGDWRSLELAIKDAAKKAARLAGPGVSAATVDAQIRQARYDRFLSRVFVDGEQSEWLLKGGMSMLARVPRARTTKDVDLAALHVADLADAEAALTSLVAVNLSDHLTFRLVRSMPTGLGDNQPGVATRRLRLCVLRRGHGQPDRHRHRRRGCGSITGRSSRSRRACQPAAPAPTTGHASVPALSSG